MSFQNPWALLVLIAIPVLIVIYLLRNRFREATAPSTYLWELSEKFLKRRNPLHKFEHLIALIVQCLTVACLAVTLAHPVLTIPGGSENYCFVLDASASMNIQSQDDAKVSRFDQAKEMIRQKVDDAANGSSYTLILSDAKTRVVCRQVTDKTRFEMYLDSVGVSTQASTLEEAMTEAQTLFSQGLCTVGYVATDKFPEDSAQQKLDDKDNVLSVLDVSSKVYNRSVSDLAYSYKLTDGEYVLTITCSVASYGGSGRLPVNFEVNGNTLGAVTDTEVEDSIPQVVTYTYTDENEQYRETPIERIDAVLDNNEKDKLAADDRATLYVSNASTQTSVHLVSDHNTTFILAALKALSCNVTVDSGDGYEQDSGYDVTIFDGYNPTTLPDDGAVWFIDSEGLNICGFNYLDSFAIEDATEDNIDERTLSYSDNAESELYDNLVKNINKDRAIYISAGRQYTMNSDGLVSVLTFNNLPIVFAGKVTNVQCATTTRDIREAVIGFDIHNSNLPMLSTFIILFKNFLDYSNPSLLTDLSYTVGDTAQLSVPDNTSYIQIFLPGETNPTTINKDSLTDLYDYPLTEFGTYKIVNYFSDTTSPKTYNIFVSYPKEEENPSATEEKTYTLVKANDAKAADGFYDSLLPITIAAAVLFALDWFLYAHEQY